MNRLPYTLDPDDPNAPPAGLIVLQTDETIEPDFRQAFADHANPLYVTRIPSGTAVTHDSLAAMEADLASAADLLPKARPYPVVGYGCTSASSVIGSDRVEALVQTGVRRRHRHQSAARRDGLRQAITGISKFALLSPYVEEVNRTLRDAFARRRAYPWTSSAPSARQKRPGWCGFPRRSVVDAAHGQSGAGPLRSRAMFLSCTNLQHIRCRDSRRFATRIGKPVLSAAIRHWPGTWIVWRDPLSD